MQDDTLARSIVRTIRQRQYVALSTFNDKMLVLFWDIGATLNHIFGRNWEDPGTQRMRESFASVLVPQFGPFFSADDILLMERFANACTSDFVRHVAGVISWKYVPIFLGLSKREEWIFYARLINEESLGPDQLSQKISEKLFDRTGLILENPDYPFAGLKEPVTDIMGFNEYFEGPKASSYRLLFEPKAVGWKPLDQQGINTAELQSIYDRIRGFQTDLHYTLNVFVNLVFWGVGKSLNESGLENEPGRLVVGEQIERQLGGFFDEGWLQACAAFESEYKGLGESAELAQLVRWDQIKLLLSLGDKTARQFYANHAFEQALTTKQLEKLIVDGFYGKQRAVQGLAGKGRARRDGTDRHLKKGNVTATLQMTAIEEKVNPNNDVNLNSYANPDLMAFLRSFNYEYDEAW